MVKSWDFWDTLAGRRTGVDPWRLFDLVGGEDYRRVRQEAERASDKTWPGIFKALQRITGWTAARVAELREAEWQAELDGVFPIAETVRQVGPRDRIVSDTYFDAKQIRRLAARIGLPDTVEVVVSWDGKWTGRYWRSAAARDIERHVGDNARSDVAQARAEGIDAVRYAGGGATATERGLEVAGLWEAAAAARAARLQNPHAPGTDEARWWDGAAGSNVPFILTAAALVREYAAASGAERIAFVSRDAILLGRAYHALYNETVAIFHASRQTLREPSAEFLTYVKRLAPGTLFVDLHGTGRTLRQFFQAADLKLAYVFVCGQARMAAHAPALAKLRGIGAGTAVEVMNYHDEGRVVDVIGGRPVRADLEYDPAPVRVHQAATLAGVRACCRPLRGVTVDHVAGAAEAVRRAVPRELLAQHQVHHEPRATRPGRQGLA